MRKLIQSFVLLNSEKKKDFEIKRKCHYNEGMNIKLGRQLIEKELTGNEEEDDEDEEMQDITDTDGNDGEILEPFLNYFFKVEYKVNIKYPNLVIAIVLLLFDDKFTG